MGGGCLRVVVGEGSIMRRGGWRYRSDEKGIETRGEGRTDLARSLGCILWSA